MGGGGGATPRPGVRLGAILAIEGGGPPLAGGTRRVPLGLGAILAIIFNHVLHRGFFRDGG